MTTATRAAPPHHRTLTCVKDYACRLPACLERGHAYERTRYRRKAYGTWQPFTDAEPARQHVHHLRAHGMSFVTVYTAAGIGSATLSRLLYGEGDSPPAAKVRVDTARRILAVTPEGHTPPDGKCIDATGARRRIQALVANGWPMKRLGQHVGRSEDHMRLATTRTQITAATDRQIRDAYRQLWDRNPAHYGISPAAITRARNLAARKGWAPPAAWDDIDDPAEQPKLGDPAPRAAALAEDGLWLEAQGHTRQQAADRLGVKKDALQQAISRWQHKQGLAA